MVNVTITLDDETARWAHLEAARRAVTVSTLLRELLRERLPRPDAYEAARRAFLVEPPKRLRATGEPLPTRAELYDRGPSR